MILELQQQLKLKYVCINNGANERFEIDDISVIRNATIVWEENFDSYPADYGYVGIDNLASAQLNSGDYPASVTKWTVTPSAGFVNQNDYAATLNGSFRFNDEDNALTFETENIDVKGVSEIIFSTDIKFGVGFEGDEYLDIYHSTDGGSTYILEASYTHTYQAGVNIIEGDAINFSKTLSGLSATNFRIKIIAYSDSNVEDFVLDNIKVVNAATASVDEVFKSSLRIYPNPLNNIKILNIESAEIGAKNISIYNVLGKKISSKTLFSNEKSINLRAIKSGVYVIKIVQDHKTATKKIIIK